MDTLEGKTAVITGGASGIGFALAEVFGERGANVVIADVDQRAMSDAVDRLKQAGITAVGVKTDVSDSAAVERLADEVVRTFGSAHVICNNAGVGPGGVTWEIQPQVWRWVMDVDVWGVINGVRAFVPLFLEQGQGHVVNTASVAGLVASPGMAPYSAAKHAVVGLSVSLRHDLELAGGSVGISVVCPSFTRTRMNDSGRNWPARLGPVPESGLAPGHPETRETYVTRMTAAMEPRLVAERAVEAVLQGRFWVVLDPQLEDRFMPQIAEILASTPPRPEGR